MRRIDEHKFSTQYIGPELEAESKGNGKVNVQGWDYLSLVSRMFSGLMLP